MFRVRCWILFIAIFCTLFAPGPSAEAGFCAWLFEKCPPLSNLQNNLRERLAERRLKSSLGGFDFTVYLTEKERFNLDPARRPRFGLPEEEIAFTESLLDRVGVGASIDGDTSEGWIRKERLFRLLSSNPFSGGMTERRLARFNSELFSIYRKSSVSILDLVTETGKTRLEKTLQYEFDRELTEHGLSRMLDDLDLLVPEGKLRARLSSITGDARFRWTFSILSNAAIAQGYLGFLPKMKWFRVSSEMADVLFKNGDDLSRIGMEPGTDYWAKLSEEDRAALRRLYKNDVAYSAFRKVYLSTASVLLGAMVYEAYEKEKTERINEIDHIVKEIHDADVRETDKDVKILNMTDRELLFNNWEDDYRERNGGSIDTTSAEYRDAVRRYLGK